VLLRTAPDGEQLFTEMQPAGQEAACRWWQATLTLSEPVVSYRFLLFTDQGAWWYNGAGLQRHNPTDAEDFRLLADYQTPAWVRESVFYQIFPDRFADGDPANNVREGEWEYRGQRARARVWGEQPSSGLEAMVEFYGGDLAGIEARLDHLEELGANALYINPVFSAYSNHRYDVVDYENVDPHLGGNPALLSLRQATRARSIRLILDIVPNHCGILHPWFQVAQADPAAPQAGYFTFHRHPDQYESWLGVRTLPKLNYRSKGLRGVMYENPDSILRRWLQPPYSMDGWRLDVANMLARQGADQMGPEVGRGMRAAIKAENPAAYILGENFFDATSQLQGDMWDASMNYSGFSKPLRYWLVNFQIRRSDGPGVIASNQPWPTQALVDTWQAYRAAIPWAIARQQYNLLGSHDTPRMLSLLGGDRAKNRLAIALLLTYVGVPGIYYGDEIGLGAEPGASARDPMPWDRQVWDLELFDFYNKLVALRRRSAALREGGFQVLLVEENLLAYLRDAEQELVIVVGNRGPGVRLAGELLVKHGAVPDGLTFSEIISGAQATVADGHLPLAALPPGVQVWQARL
ncbi:MAG: alpha-amylase family glycosyl hydrolase, partial [Anaerolineales bacterium]